MSAPPPQLRPAARTVVFNDAGQYAILEVYGGAFFRKAIVARDMAFLIDGAAARQRLIASRGSA